MKQERSARHACEKPSVPMTAASDFVVPDGTDELSRNTRRAWRDRLNDAQTRKMITGVLATLVGGSFWGFSGTSASFLFDTYHVDTLWLMSVRQILAGLLFMAVVVARDRARLVKLWTTPADRKQLLLFTAFGLLFNQFCYLSAVRLTNAGTATVLQCLQLVIIMGYACVVDRRMPRARETIGIGLALGGTFLIVTGGDPTSLSISPLGLVAGLMCAVSATCMAVIPAKILPEYGSPIVTGSAMLAAGMVSCVFVQPWAHMPALDRLPVIEARLRCCWSLVSFLLHAVYAGREGHRLGACEPHRNCGAGFGDHHQRCYAGHGVFADRPYRLCMIIVMMFLTV
mgnify:CR=1 FL=1